MPLQQHTASNPPCNVSMQLQTLMNSQQGLSLRRRPRGEEEAAITNDGHADHDHLQDVDLQPHEDAEEWPCCDRVEPFLLLPKQPKHWAVFILTYGSATALVLWFFIWAFPKIVDSAYQPAVDKFETQFSRFTLGVIVFWAVALIPLTVFLPREPFIWVAASIYHVGTAFAIVMAGNILGVALPFLLTRFWLRPKLLRFFRRYKYTNAVLLGIKQAGPFMTTLILRLGPVPAPWTNYLMAVPDNVGFWVYMLASTIGTTPGVLLEVIFGRNIKGLAALLKGQSIPTSQLVVNLVSLGAALILAIAGFIYAKRALAQLEAQADNVLASRRAASARERQLDALEAGNGNSELNGNPMTISHGLPEQQMPLRTEPSSSTVHVVSSGGATDSRSAHSSGRESRSCDGSGGGSISGDDRDSRYKLFRPPAISLPGALGSPRHR